MQGFGFGKPSTLGFGLGNITGQQGQPNTANNPASANPPFNMQAPFGMAGQPNVGAFGTVASGAVSGGVANFVNVPGVTSPTATTPEVSVSPGVARNPIAVTPANVAAASAMRMAASVSPGKIGRKMGDVHEVAIDKGKPDSLPPAAEVETQDTTSERPGAGSGLGVGSKPQTK